jgi:hypothetical protein
MSNTQESFDIEDAMQSAFDLGVKFERKSKSEFPLDTADASNVLLDFEELSLAVKIDITQVKFQHETLVKQRDDLLAALKLMTSLTRLKYGNLDKDVYSEIEKSERLIAKCEAENGK